MVEVNVKGGTINGISDGQIDRFLGIPMRNHSMQLHVLNILN